MRLLRRLSLQYQIAAGVVLGVVALLSIFAWLAVQTIGETRDLALEGRLATANASAHAIDAIILHEAEELEATAAQMATMETAQSEREFLLRTYEVLDDFGSILRLDAGGKPLWAIPSSSYARDWPFASDPEASDAIRDGRPAIFRPSRSASDRLPLAVLIAPIQNDAGETTGFLAGELEISEGHLGLIPLTTLSEDATAFLVDDAGEIIVQTGDEPLTAEDWEATTIEHLVGLREAGTTIDDDHGPSHVEAYHPLDTLAAGVVVEEREDRALAIPKRMERDMLWIGIGAVIAAAIGVWLHSRSVIRPIRDLTKASATIAAGSLDDPIQVTRGDEIGQLARSFEGMRKRLKESQEERRRWEGELEDRVRQRTQEVQSLLGKVISAQEEERMRIARELHDEPAQNLVALLAGIQAAEAALPSSPCKAKQTLSSLRPSAKRALEEMRKSILDLRPSALDDLGLAPAIRWYAESRLKPAGLNVHWDAPREPDHLPEPTAIALFRITQEAITNTVKHAQAHQVWIRISCEDSVIAIEVQDDGRGFDEKSLHPSPTDTRGLGILGMKERASLVGGVVKIESGQGKGTTVRIEVPVEGGNDGFGQGDSNSNR